MAISSKDADDIRRLLECPICLERPKTPRQLPCIHTFCHECLQTFIDKRGKGGKFSCPRCNRLFDIPKDGAAGFAFNHFINHLNDCVPKTTNVFCYVCHCKGSTVGADFMCIQCAHHLCKKCADVHCQTGITLTHKVVSLEEVAAGMHFEAIREHQTVCCPKHPDKLLEIYCEQCKTPVCLLCKALEHDHHEMKNIEEAAQEAIEVLTALMEPWIDAVDHTKALSDERKNIREELNQELLQRKVEELGKIFDDFKKKMDDELETKRSEAITKLTEKFESVQKQSQAAYEAAEHSRLSLMSTLRYAKRLVERAHPAETTLQYHDMAATLTSLDISQFELNADRHVFNFVPPELSVPNVSVDSESTVESQLMDTKVSQLHLSSKSPVQPVTPPLTVKEPAGSVGSFTSRGEGEWGSWCWGLAVCDGGFVVTDRYNNTVKVFDKHDCKLKLKLQQTHYKLQTPFDVTCHKDGHIFITDYGIKGVVRYDGRGEVVKVCRDVYECWGFVTCHGDRLVVCDEDGGRVLITDLNCDIHQQLDGPTLGLSKFRPGYVCMDNCGQLVVSECEPGRVHVIDPTRPAVVSTLTHQLSDGPHGVCVDPHGHILVADCDNNQVILYNNARAHVIVPPGGVQRPTGLCLPAPGQVSVVECITGVVKTFQYLEE